MNANLTQNGLYSAEHEHDSCGVGFIVNIKNNKSHEIVDQGLTILERLHHRGAVGADPKAGDGAGIMVQIPDDFLRKAVDFELPQSGKYAVGMLFMPKDVKQRQIYKKLVKEIVENEHHEIIGWRQVPVDNSDLGYSVIPTEPAVRQVFIKCPADVTDQDEFERRLFIIHKQISSQAQERELDGYFYICSFSSRTLIYKGMLLAHQIREYYLDLKDKDFSSALALVHQRFSTNTFPTWDLAHPFRMIAHNGEINTIRGNKNWLAARKNSMQSKLFSDIDKAWPIIQEDQSDSASFDNCLELLHKGGYSLAHAIMMMIPESWGDNIFVNKDSRAFYEFHSALMEPWDGPAAIAFSDGRQIGATLDRNGLRPARYLITKNDTVVMASEVGVLDIPEDQIIKKWRLQPGKMFLIDLEQGRIIDDIEVKKNLALEHPYQKYIDKSQLYVHQLPIEPCATCALSGKELMNVQQAFSYTQEDIKFLLKPMLQTGVEALGSMGTDIPPAVLSNRARHLSNYFKQNFAQVTNPPIDPIREELVMSLRSYIGPKPNILDFEHDCSHMRLATLQPVISNDELNAINKINEAHPNFKTKTIDITYSVEHGAEGMKAALKSICYQAEKAVKHNYNILILSDRGVNKDNVAIHSLLATSAVHHHLIKKGLRTETGLVIETGSALEVHHFATLAGYGAEAINPWLVYDTILDIADKTGTDAEKYARNYVKAIGKGLKKVMSKMGISTYRSYCGAQIFDAVGLSSSFIDKYFTGTTTTIEGVDLPEVSEEAIKWHEQGFGAQRLYEKSLDAGGVYAFRARGEKHVWNPTTIAKLQHAVRSNSAATYSEYAELVNKQDKDLLTLRGLMEFEFAEQPLPLDEVEPAKEIVKRFSTGAMSFGSISYEAHSTLAIAMNCIGGKSNTGEGGEEPARFDPLEDGSPNPERSAIKQVASGRFGVTTEYLVNSDEIQIKMAQGAKPGEGGQLPGHKVNQQIGKVRHSTPGVGLISPPPHHDIYSIEDLAQLVHDLKNVNPKARISVKLVSEVGVGTVAAGVAKCKADHITIAGYDGGTGASPLTSIKHAGGPWEIGLSETHQTLVLNKLRSRACVQTDGGLRTGRDVVIAALLGADEMGFATAPLIAEGCIMMRKCHLNTCPVGVATQDPELRKKFTGKPEHVINYFFFVAEEVRKLMSKLGYRKFDEMIGQMDKLNMRKAIKHWKAKGLDYSRILAKPFADDPKEIYNTGVQDHGLDKALDNEIIQKAQTALDNQTNIEISHDIHNYNRTFGTMLSGEVARRYGHAGLADDTITINLKGTAGQSLGAWLAKGISIKLQGDANDYVGKGLSGGKIIVYPPADAAINKAEDNIVVGNTVLFGAISGEAYFSGMAGERFCVRNSGAHAVIEGVGDHGCEYMTGGVVACLGRTGRNFAAGMSGGVAYVYDIDGDFERKVNPEMVELEKIQMDTGKVDLNDMLGADETRLKLMIENHVKYTGSKLGADILSDWQQNLKKFIKIMPKDFTRALTELKKQADAA